MHNENPHAASSVIGMGFETNGFLDGRHCICRPCYAKRRIALARVREWCHTRPCPGARSARCDCPVNSFWWCRWLDERHTSAKCVVMGSLLSGNNNYLCRIDVYHHVDDSAWSPYHKRPCASYAIFHHRLKWNLGKIFNSAIHERRCVWLLVFPISVECMFWWRVVLIEKRILTVIDRSWQM